MNLKPHQKVQILDDSLDYHGKYGIVTDVVEDVALIMCVGKSWDRYWVFEGSEDKVVVI